MFCHFRRNDMKEHWSISTECEVVRYSERFHFPLDLPVTYLGQRLQKFKVVFPNVCSKDISSKDVNDFSRNCANNAISLGNHYTNEHT